MVKRVSSYIPKGGHSATQTELKIIIIIIIIIIMIIIKTLFQEGNTISTN